MSSKEATPIAVMGKGASTPPADHCGVAKHAPEISSDALGVTESPSHASRSDKKRPHGELEGPVTTSKCHDNDAKGQRRLTLTCTTDGEQFSPVEHECELQRSPKASTSLCSSAPLSKSATKSSDSSFSSTDKTSTSSAVASPLDNAVNLVYAFNQFGYDGLVDDADDPSMPVTVKNKSCDQPDLLAGFNHMLLETMYKRCVQWTSGQGYLCGILALVHSFNDQICRPLGLELSTVEDVKAMLCSGPYFNLARNHKPSQYYDNHKYVLKRRNDLEFSQVALLAEMMGRKRGVRVELVICRAAYPGAAAHELCAESNYLAEYPAFARQCVYIHHNGARYKPDEDIIEIGHYSAITERPLSSTRTTEPLKTILRQPQGLKLRRDQLCEAAGGSPTDEVQVFTDAAENILLTAFQKLLNDPKPEQLNHIQALVESFNDQIRKPRNLTSLTASEVWERLGTEEYVELILQKLPRYVENSESGLQGLCMMDTGKLELQAMQLEILVELMGNDIGLHCTLSTIWSKHGTSLQYSLNVTQSNTICNVVTEADNLVWIGKIGGGVTGYSSITADRGDDKHCEKEDQCEKVESCETEELDEKDEQCEKKERCEKEEQCEKEKEKEKQG